MISIAAKIPCAVRRVLLLGATSRQYWQHRCRKEGEWRNNTGWRRKDLEHFTGTRNAKKKGKEEKRKRKKQEP